MTDNSRHRRKKTRIDAAHTMRADPTKSAEGEMATAMQSDGASVSAVAANSNATVDREQLDRHAFDLGRRLQEQQLELDRRESEFHAHLGEVEHELRSARLLAAERAAELANRESELERCEREAKAVLAKAMSKGSTSATENHFASAELQSQSQELKLAMETWRKRLSEVDTSERQLQSQISTLGFERRQMAEQRQESEEQFTQLMQRVESERHNEKTRFEQQLGKLKKREEEVDRRELAVEQLHSDVTRLYRESIELRLCTQQQWSELCETGSEADLTRTRAELRRKLMEQFQLSEQRVQDERLAVEGLLSQLEEHRQNIDAQRTELREWAIRRNKEIERDSVKVMEREQELNRQLSEHRFLEQQWLEQQAGFEQEIRRLRRLVNHA